MIVNLSCIVYTSYFNINKKLYYLILFFFFQEELAENVTELMVPVVPMVLPKASQDHNMKQDVQADPAPFTILVKSEDMPSQVFQPQPGTSFDFPAPSMMPTTIEEVKDKVLDEPIVVPKFNRCVSFVRHTDTYSLFHFYLIYFFICFLVSFLTKVLYWKLCSNRFKH